MKSLLVVAILMAPVTAHASTGPDIPSVATQLRCTWLTLQQAARGDFSQWVLPDLVPGRHLQAGEFPDCLPGYDRPRFLPPPAPGADTHDKPNG